MPSEIRKDLRAKTVVAFLLAASAFLLVSCGEKHFRLTQEQVEERIKKDLPAGATQEQVKQFLASFKPEFEVEECEYSAEVSSQPDAEKPATPAPTYHGIIRARIRKIGRDPKIFALFDLHLEFYFDETGLFAGHKLKTVGYH